MAYRTSAETALMKEQKKQALAQVAAGVFSSLGYHATSVKAIVEAAGQSVGSFYFYFKNKEEIFSSLYKTMSDLVFQDLNAALAAENLSVVARFVRGEASRLRSYQQHRDLARILFIEGLTIAPAFQAKRKETLERSLELKIRIFQSLRDKGFLGDMDLRVAALAFDGSANNLILDWLQQDRWEGLVDQAPTLIRYGLRALGIPFLNHEIEGELARYWQEFPLEGRPQ